MEILRDRSATAGELADALPIARPGVSRHLRVLREAGLVEARQEAQRRTWLTAEGPRTRLVVEERGLPGDELHHYGAGWQAHLEDLGRSVSGAGPVHPEGWSSQAAAPGWRERWTALVPAYR